MPICQNCGAHVTEDYARVFTRRDEEGVECCPKCPDLLREDGEIRAARSKRATKASGAQEATEYDPLHGGDGQ